MEKVTAEESTHQVNTDTTPMKIIQRYRYVTLAGDMMYVNGIFFINTILYHIKFMMADHIVNK